MKQTITVNAGNTPTVAVYDNESSLAFWGNNFTTNIEGKDKKTKSAAKLVRPKVSKKKEKTI